MGFANFVFVFSSLTILLSAGIFFRALFTQGMKQGHNQFMVKLLPMPAKASSEAFSQHDSL